MPAKSSLHIIQVVRRFGPVGGMESYVWNLTLELVKMGCSVSVICEESYQAGNCPELPIFFVKKGWAKPRWIGLLQFSFRVSRLIKFQKLNAQIIHSHERTAVHNFTTFHGPPFALIRDLPIWKWLSLRVLAYLWMEYRELLGQKVKVVIPNSRVISQHLLRCYPKVQERLARPIPPGVSCPPIRPFTFPDPLGGTVGFIGKEWKRKGLVFALEIFRHLRKSRPNLKLLLLGPDPSEIGLIHRDFLNPIETLGWQDATPHYQKMDLLLHPAKQEPFGMVIIEAMAARVPVVISDVCGAADYVTPAHGEILTLSTGVQAWVDACDRQLSRAVSPPGFERGWDQVAKEYLLVYKSVSI